MMIVPGYYGHLWLVLAVWSMIAVFGALILFIIFLVLYFLGSYVNWQLGKKFGIGSFAKFLIPVYGTMLLCDCAKVTRWLTVFFVLPLFVGGLGSFAGICLIISYMFLYGRIAQRLGRNPWIWGIISVLFLGIPIMVMALDSSMPEDGENVKNDGGDDPSPRYIDISKSH